MAEGMEKGMAEGIEKGRAEGEQNIINMLKSGKSAEEIIKLAEKSARSLSGAAFMPIALLDEKNAKKHSF